MQYYLYFVPLLIIVEAVVKKLISESFLNHYSKVLCYTCHLRIYIDQSTLYPGDIHTSSVIDNLCRYHCDIKGQLMAHHTSWLLRCTLRGGVAMPAVQNVFNCSSHNLLCVVVTSPLYCDTVDIRHSLGIMGTQ